MKEKEKILEMLSKGSINVDQAKELLDALEYEDPIEKKKNVFSFDVDKAKEGLAGLEKTIAGFFNETLSSIFDRDYSFRIKGSFDRFQKKYEKNLQEIDLPSIFIQNRNGKVVIDEGEGENIVIYTTVYYKDMVISEDTSFYTIEEKEGEIRFVSKIPDGVTRQFYLELEVKLPKKYYGFLHIETSNAPIVAKNIQARELEIETSNGKIALSESISDHLYIITSNGSMDLNQVDSKEGVLASSNGRVIMEDIHVEDLRVNTSNGKISGENVDVKNIRLITSNGSVRLEKLATNMLKKAEIQSSNGDIYLLLKALHRPASFDLSTSTGAIHIGLPITMNAGLNKEGFTKNKHVKGRTHAYEEGQDDMDFVISTSNAKIILEEEK